MVDVDGTLANVDSIRHLVEGANRDFEEFHLRSIDVPPIDPVVKLVNSYKADDYVVIAISGRKEKFRSLTDFWFALHEIPVDLLLLRANQDQRKDVLVKKDFYEHLIQTYEIDAVIDDRDDLISLWKSLAISHIFDARTLAAD